MNFSSLLGQLEGTALSSLEEFLSEESLGRIRHGDIRRRLGQIGQLPQIRPSMTDFRERVLIGDPADCDEATRPQLRNQLLDFIPWRKGPFEVFGIELDCEWRADMKWARLDGQIAPLKGRRVLDVGCGNGYYCFRMLGRQAGQVIGLEPHIPYAMQFWALKSFVPDANCWVLPMALEDFPGRSEYFDSAFSMGVLYHVRSPLDHLVSLHDSLRPGGELVLETIFVEGGEGYSLTPKNRYAQMRNVWFIPSIATLEVWLERCGFVDWKIIDRSITTPEEQRTTEWMPFESLVNSLDREDSKRTIEGYPAPMRVMLTARRPD
ncbi:MAG: tRNA 5-methoxyuridine(34)/uridine 5-oxyacetic acid(34) synthase CmoB [Gammaproteobacteria bacterium]|nr:tRNA 5-methoxyuridine(34)/uridine 5-oxyacetic acid(34) synthase CmoB [Gammaproteobacteria bacterium]MYC61140.1 tRNA 5-methoxyuridine(34)/uridine 5-oxyacetic acid(34) synthase CmoB [Gammaproteobacteria bacterium]